MRAAPGRLTDSSGVTMTIKKAVIGGAAALLIR